MDEVSDYGLDYLECDVLKEKVDELITKVNEIVTWINAQS